MLANMEKDWGLLDDKHELVCKCGQARCLNPLHWTVIEKENRVLKYNKDEVADLETVLDLDRLDQIGFIAYFEEFNTGNPLPADMVDFFVACNRKLAKGRRKLLGESLLDEI